MPSLFISVAPEWAPAREQLESAGVETRRHPAHVQYLFDEELVIDRETTGLRHALWYSLVSGVDGAHVEQYDKVCLRVVADGN